MKINNKISQVGLFTFFLSVPLSPALSNISLFILLITFFIDLICKKIPRKFLYNPIIFTLLLWNTYVLISFINGYYSQDIDTTLLFTETIDFIKLNIFYLIAWAIYKTPKSILQLFIVFVIGLLLNTVLETNYNHYIYAISHFERIGYGMEVYYSGLYWSLLIIGFFSFVWPIIIKNNQLSTSRTLTAFYITLFSIQAIVLGQSRITWIALVLIVPILIIHIYYQRPRAIIKISSAQKICIMLNLLLLGVIFFFLAQFVYERVFNAPDPLSAWLNPNSNNLALSSLSMRLPYWQYAIELIQEKPLLGSGISFKDYSELEKELSFTIPHLHSVILEILVRFGFIGFTIISVTTSLMLYQLITAYRYKQLSINMLLFISMSYLLLFIWSLTDWHILDGYYRNLWFMFAALNYMYYIKRLTLPHSLPPDKSNL